MDTALLQQLVKNELALIASVRQAELAARSAISGDGLQALLAEFFPGIDAEFLTANKRIPNHLQRGVTRYVNALTRSTVNWEWEGGDTPPTTGTPEEVMGEKSTVLVSLQEMTVDALTSGKFAIWPYVDAAGILRVSVLNGFLWPIYASGSSTVLDGLLQITSRSVAGKIRYQVRQFSPGLLTVYDDLENWQKFVGAPKVDFPQTHAPDRLPVAFRVVGRDANRQPQGLAQAAMDAFSAYVKARVLVNFLSHRGGFEERVMYSDAMLELAKKDPKHALVQAMLSVGPNKLRLGGSGDKYERLSPVQLQDYREQAAEAKADLLDTLNLPDVDGASLAGVALIEKREAYTEAVQGFAVNEQSAMTEVLSLGAALAPSQLRAGWRASVTPHFTQDSAAERTAIREDVKAGVLPISAAMSGLQALGITYITEDMIKAQQALEQLDRVPDGTVAG